MDIPIRPRYGIPDELPPDGEADPEDRRTERTNTETNRHRKSSASDQQMASSYSEIPFLAQYPGAVPPEVAARAQQALLQSSDSLEEEEDSDNSKDSSCEANKTPKRPNSMHSSFPYELEGSTSDDGEMRHFVAENLEDKLRTTSPLNKHDQYGGEYVSRDSTPSTSTIGGLMTRRFMESQTLQIDPNVLGDIEIEAQYLATSVDNLTENLGNLLHSISAITAENVEVHKNAVSKLTDSMDANIKCMYTIMAKTEEISKSMKPTEALGQRIREIKRLVDMLDNTM